MTKNIRLEDIEQESCLEEVQRIRSGIRPLDTMLQGGFATGQIVQLVGETKTGRTTLALQISHNFCKQNKNVLFIDAKGDINKEYLEYSNLLGYCNKGFYLVKESTFGKVEEQLDKFIKTDEIDLIIVDALPSLINERCIKLDGSKRIKSDNNNTNAGTRPLVFLTNKLKKLSVTHNFGLLFINEYRQRIDKVLGTINRVAGPKCLGYESSSIIQIKRITSGDNKSFKDCFNSLEKENIGVADELVQLKGTTMMPLAPIPFFFEYGYGYQEEYNIIYFLLNNGSIKRDGTYYEFMNYKANGIANLMQTLNDNGIMQQLINNADSLSNKS